MPKASKQEQMLRLAKNLAQVRQQRQLVSSGLMFVHLVSFLRSSLTRKAKRKLTAKAIAAYPLAFVAPSLFSLHSAWNQSMSAARRSPKALAAKGTEASVVPTQWA